MWLWVVAGAGVAARAAQGAAPAATAPQPASHRAAQRCPPHSRHPGPRPRAHKHTRVAPTHRLRLCGLGDKLDDLVEEERARKLHAAVEELEHEGKDDAAVVAAPDAAQHQPARLPRLRPLQDGGALRRTGRQAGGGEGSGPAAVGRRQQPGGCAAARALPPGARHGACAHATATSPAAAPRARPPAPHLVAQAPRRLLLELKLSGKLGLHARCEQRVRLCKHVLVLQRAAVAQAQQRGVPEVQDVAAGGQGHVGQG